jgi:hypothetical protein
MTTGEFIREVENVSHEISEFARRLAEQRPSNTP